MSGTNQHTPGPWSVRPSLINLKYVHITSAEMDGIACLSSEHDANAKLIAAAPELLEALNPVILEVIADEIGSDFKHTARADSLRILARQARAAISKATGGAQ